MVSDERGGDEGMMGKWPKDGRKEVGVKGHREHLPVLDSQRWCAQQISCSLIFFPSWALGT